MKLLPILPEIVIYEDGDKKGTYFADTINKTAETGIIKVTCQDNSKRLTDYFVAEMYEAGESVTYAKYWINIFLDLAGVSVNYVSTGDGGLVNPNSSLGFEAVYN